MKTLCIKYHRGKLIPSNYASKKILHSKHKVLTVKPLSHGTTTLVEGDVSIFVGDGDRCSGIDEIFRDGRIAPEAGVVQWGVAVLINKVHVCLVPQQLCHGQDQRRG